MATADDYYVVNIVGNRLGVTPHTTGMMHFQPDVGNDYKIHNTQLSYYNFSIQESCPFYYTKNSKFINARYTDLSILAKRTIKKGEVIEGLYGATYPIEPQYIVRGQNDFSLIQSGRLKWSKLELLFLGPAAFCNHDCEANAEIICISKLRSGVKAIENIQAGEEITVYCYGNQYFDDGNLLCQCQTCSVNRLTVVDKSPSSSNTSPHGERDEVFDDQPVEHSLTTPAVISSHNESDGSNDATASEKTTEQITVVDKSPPSSNTSPRGESNVVFDDQPVEHSLTTPAVISSHNKSDGSNDATASEKTTEQITTNRKATNSAPGSGQRKKKIKLFLTNARTTQPSKPESILRQKESKDEWPTDSSIGDESSNEFDEDPNNDAGDGNDNDDDNNDDDDNDEDDKINPNGMQMYACNQCPKTFKYKSWFNRHITMHKKSIFLCSYCPMTFNKKVVLQLHTQIHSGKKKFKCSECVASYNDKSNLFNHLKVKHNPKPPEYKCDRCGQAFNCSRNLRYHMNMHNGITPYKCSLCGLAFSSPPYLSKHFKKMHPSLKKTK